MIRILIVDDEYQLIDAFRKKLSKEGMEVLVALNGKDAINIIKNESIDIGLFDIRLPDINGVDLLGKLKEMQPTAEVIMLTGHASVDTAIKSMKLGAYDYLTKPCRLVELHNVILKAYEKKQLKEKNIVLEEHIHRIEIRDRFIGESKEMKEIKKFISLVSNSNVPVLLLGETGTGKEFFARAIHNLSYRKNEVFMAINCGAIPENLI